MNAITSPHQFPDGDVTMPRFREAGDVTLDLLHRDGRVEDCWLGLTPREFALLWRLAEQPGERLTREQLLAEVWPIRFAPEPNSLAAHVEGLRARLEPLGLGSLIAAHPGGGYVLEAHPAARLSRLGGMGPG